MLRSLASLLMNALSKSRLALVRYKGAIIGIKPLFWLVMRGFFDDFLLMTIFFLTLILIADKLFYSVI
ncbi:hypothetical protein HPAKL117_06430 [Helicobacter pylori Aklavik117]|nr:hypothetical protein HPAKL117_06430 [Helicobacter pylori Aklavik117]